MLLLFYQRRQSAANTSYNITFLHLVKKSLLLVSLRIVCPKVQTSHYQKGIIKRQDQSHPIRTHYSIPHHVVHIKHVQKYKVKSIYLLSCLQQVQSTRAHHASFLVLNAACEHSISIDVYLSVATHILLIFKL